MKVFLACILTLSALASAAVAPTPPPPVPTDPVPSTFLELAQVKQLMAYLTTVQNVKLKQSGTTYVASAGTLKGVTLPLSFYSTAEYFGDYVCNAKLNPGNDCSVVDKTDPLAGVIPVDSVGGRLQLERVNVLNGLNIYDSSCWQIATALYGAKTKDAAMLKLSSNHDLLINISHSGDDPNAVVNSNRGLTKPDGTFEYNNIAINSTSLPGMTADEIAKMAYPFRMVPRQWISNDPFMGTPYSKYISFPEAKAAATKAVAAKVPNTFAFLEGQITWQDYKLITGETTWGMFIGPLQALYQREVVVAGAQCVGISSTPIQNAIKVLHAIKAMQSSVGAIYYISERTLGNSGGDFADLKTVSVENNASALAGLQMLLHLLNCYAKTPGFEATAKLPEVVDAQYALNILLNGGLNDVTGYATPGLYAFFAKTAWSKKLGHFYTTGTVAQGANGTFVPDENLHAVDVVTWALATLGVDAIDKEQGQFAAFNAWKATKAKSGFYVGKELRGVGYSNLDGNGLTPKPKEVGILSGEWTFGAIAAVRTLQVQYKAQLAQYAKTPKAAPAVQLANILKELLADELSMIKGVNAVRTDIYGIDKTTSVELTGHIPPQFNTLLPMSKGQLAYMYASKRYNIPFGWIANPLPSLTSTAWAVYTHYNFNPLVLGGGYMPYKG